MPTKLIRRAIGKINQFIDQMLAIYHFDIYVNYFAVRSETKQPTFFCLWQR